MTKRWITALLLAALAPWALATNGVVKEVDADKGEVRIRHDAIKDPKHDVDLPAMTMKFKADSAALKGLSPGDKVSFTASRDAGGYVASDIRKR